MNVRAHRWLSAGRLAMAISMVLAVTALPGCSSEPEVSAEPEVYADADVPIVVREGDSFVLSLPDSPDTGYQWDAEFDESVLQLVSDDLVFAEDRECQLCTWGDYRFVFTATEVAESTVVVTLRRPLEDDDIADQRLFNVTVTRR